MELILINDSKLKITLSPSDMKEYEISCESVDYGKTETRRAFWSILDTAKRKTGFDAASEKVYIQMYPSKEGGCEMYVTKLGFTSPDESVDLEKADNSELAYRFSELDSLLRVCKQLSYAGLSCAGEAWKGENGYYLFLDVGQCEPFDCFAFISEFGESCDIDGSRTYLCERGSLICGSNAVKALAELF